ncbi:hypothetical protein [Paenibacillus polymyxa]|uniref:hypothetical protein n=1 Tax=Paenibacillus polymyxa TaxID=1406 RepID=UPI002AB46C18|nr:hypothetical protein [Paenibacillus polymyxa]MDY8021723.1 hypothetical protein [Paenibacillus polymyxa]
MMEAVKKLTQHGAEAQLRVIVTPLDQFVYSRFDEHFRSLQYTDILAAVPQSLPNTRKMHYAWNASIPLDHRIRSVEAILAVMVERSKSVHPTYRELTALELLADFLLAEDLANGLMLRDRFREEPDEYSQEYPPLGGAARAYQEMEMNFLTPAMLKRRKVCECCRSYFIDTSPGVNAKRCGPRCTRWAEMLRIRRHRNEGDERRKRDQARQQHEYPFYSPYELEHVNQFSEVCYKEDTIDRKVQVRNKGGRQKPQGLTMDSEQVSTHFRLYQPSQKGESGVVSFKKRRPEVVKRYLRMKYGDKLNTPYRFTY